MYHHPDHLSVRASSDGTSGSPTYGQKIGEQGHFPFGEAWYAANTTTKWEFTTYERDAESGNDYAMARYHVNRLGRFSSPDPSGLDAVDAGNPQSWSAYAYTLDDPINFVDPTGRWCITLPPTGYVLCEVDGNGGGGGGFGGGGIGGGGGGGGGCAPNADVAGLLRDSEGTNLWPHVQPEAACGGGGGGRAGGGGGSGAGAAGSNGSQQPQKPCGPSTGPSIISGNATTNAPTIAAGAAIGGLVGGEEGAAVGGIIGSFFGVGGNVSYVPSTHSLYAGPTVVFAPALGGGNGFGANALYVPSSQNPNSIASGLSFSATFQPLPFFGSTVVKTPGSGPPVVGPSIGTRIPVSYGASDNFSIIKGCG